MTPAVSDPTVEARIAEVLVAHAWCEYDPVCSCGWAWDVRAWCKTIDTSDIAWTAKIAPARHAAYASHVADLLAARAAAPDALRVRIAGVLDDYAPTARRQRGCPDRCGCTDCEMVEDLRALLEDGAQ